MVFSILHLSDLHRDLSDEVDNVCLLDSLTKDVEQFDAQDPQIKKPSLCVVTGDLVYGIKPNTPNNRAELERQYAQAEEFLVGLADRLFDGKRERLVILPGNHDVCYDDVQKSASRIDVPIESAKKLELVTELFKPRSELRWSWSELCFYRITDRDRYLRRLGDFAATYERFYQGSRRFSLVPEEQFEVFDFPDEGLCILALSSCYNNDPLRRAGAFHPTSVAQACRAAAKPFRAGRLIGAAWHHNLVGGPTADDYLDVEVLQLLIDAGVSLGFHGHQHRTDCVEERNRIGSGGHKMTIMSAGTLCAGPRNLAPGEPRSFNVVEINTDAWTGRVHQRKMLNRIYNLPIWGPGHFDATNKSYLDFDLRKPLMTRPATLDSELTLERADKLLGSARWSEATEVLTSVKHAPLARPMLVRALAELGDSRRTIDALWPPATIAETVSVGGAILHIGTPDEAAAFLKLDFVSNSQDASVREVSRRIRERRLR